MTTTLTVESISAAMKGADFWLNPDSEASSIVSEATRRGFIKRLSHTQAQWTEAGLTKARAELGVTAPSHPMSDTARRYAEKTQATLKALADTEDAHTAALRRHDMEEVERLRLEAVGLVAVLRLRAADLADLTLAAAPARCDGVTHGPGNCQPSDSDWGAEG